MSSDPENEYFSDGMTEEITNALGKIEGLKVTARSSAFAFKKHKEDVRIIGNKLGVSTVIEGSIRKSGDRVRISAQLIRTDNGFLIWNENFDRHLTDIFELQDEISLLIADKIRENFGHLEIKDHLVETNTSNVEAYELFLKAVYHFRRKDFDDIQLALKLFQQVVELDPNYAEAYAYMGDTYLHYTGFNLMSVAEGYDNVKACAEKALAINPNEARAHKLLAYRALFYDWNWDEAISAYNQAIDCGLNSDNEFISYYYIFIQKDFDEAIKVAQEAVYKDPMYILSHWQLGICYYFAGRFKEAIKAMKACLELDANFSEALRWMAVNYAYLNQFEEAFQYIDKALEITQGAGLAQIDRLTIRILKGERETIISELEDMEHVDPLDPAQLYSLLNMPEKAVPLLQQGLKDRAVMMVSLKHYWIWDNIRQDSGFQTIVEHMNFGQQKSHKSHQTTSQLVPASQFNLTDAEIQELLHLLQTTMSEEDHVVEHSLTLRTLAELMNIHPNKLSWILNDQLGKNFNEYINELRLNIFLKKATDKAYSHLSILGLAYESGFTSKSVFNDYFKKKTGLTPKAWIKKNG